LIVLDANSSTIPHNRESSTTFKIHLDLATSLATLMRNYYCPKQPVLSSRWVFQAWIKLPGFIIACILVTAFIGIIWKSEHENGRQSFEDNFRDDHFWCLFFEGMFWWETSRAVKSLTVFFLLGWLLQIFVATASCKLAIKELKKWMAPQKVQSAKTTTTTIFPLLCKTGFSTSRITHDSVVNFVMLFFLSSHIIIFLWF
jgi:hypothetical protein